LRIGRFALTTRVWKREKMAIFTIERSIEIQATAETVWLHVVDVDIASFDHPAYFSVLGIPKPLRAEMVKPGLHQKRMAYFSGGRTFSQVITAWVPNERCDFSFEANPGFRVVYLLDLHSGPFQMKSASYKIRAGQGGVRLSLSNDYVLNGIFGMGLDGPVRVVLSLFQRYLLSGIKANAEGQEKVI
jgi:hypothetical protein